jgi:ribosomal-protein-alanine N-acetyltransferase
MNFVIEKAAEKDKPDIFRLLKIANMHYIPSEEMPELTFENYYVCRIDGETAGFCGYKILSPTTAKTELMVVDPKCRGKGIGFKLQEFRMMRMYEQGIKILITNSDIPDTIDWYKKYFGYKEVGTLKKIHEFGRKDIDHWTTLQVDLQQWAKNRDK